MGLIFTLVMITPAIAGIGAILDEKDRQVIARIEDNLEKF